MLCYEIHVFDTKGKLITVSLQSRNTAVYFMWMETNFISSYTAEAQTVAELLNYVSSTLL